MAVKIVSICSSISLKVMKCFFIKENYAIFVHMASLQPTKKKKYRFVENRLDSQPLTKLLIESGGK